MSKELLQAVPIVLYTRVPYIQTRRNMCRYVVVAGRNMYVVPSVVMPSCQGYVYSNTGDSSVSMASDCLKIRQNQLKALIGETSVRGR